MFFQIGHPVGKKLRRVAIRPRCPRDTALPVGALRELGVQKVHKLMKSTRRPARKRHSAPSPKRRRKEKPKRPARPARHTPVRAGARKPKAAGAAKRPARRLEGPRRRRPGAPAGPHKGRR